ncbi:MAG: dTDP-4-dehydrorhamnose 3,5-epimerase [Verrucomicrobia bacterium]|nr:dTDP-4-dehydrorhamnose 3,5-epimerase [Verrucomicrobiota bacterium]
MQITPLSLEGVQLIRPRTFADARGFFRESYRLPLYRDLGIACSFVQDNHSYSAHKVLRGMHFQPGQAKLISVIEGEIFDVVIDIRPESPHFGKWEGIYLSGKEGNQLFIPDGYAHGFCVLSMGAHVCYKVSAVYDPLLERGFRYDDPTVGIAWPLSEPILSERDQLSPYLEEVMQ